MNIFKEIYHHVRDLYVHVKRIDNDIVNIKQGVYKQYNETDVLYALETRKILEQQMIEMVKENLKLK